MRDLIRRMLFLALSVAIIGGLWVFADYKAALNDPAPSIAPMNSIRIVIDGGALDESAHPEYATGKIVA